MKKVTSLPKPLDLVLSAKKKVILLENAQILPLRNQSNVTSVSKMATLLVSAQIMYVNHNSVTNAMKKVI